MDILSMPDAQKMSFSVWEKNDLEGEWEFSIKIDGIRCHLVNDKHFSRKMLPLYNITQKDFVVAEIYCGSLDSTISKVRSSKKVNLVKDEEIYSLYPVIDERLNLGKHLNPTKETIEMIYKQVKALGFEGLVLKQKNVRLKVKPEETYDEIITGLYPGKNSNKGLLGGFYTNKGKVGTGLTKKQREEFNTEKMIGETIEVQCMELTKNGKFRHPKFIRHRWDK